MFTSFKNNILFLFGTLFLMISMIFMESCTSDKYVPDVSHIKSDVKVNRFEQDLFAIDTNNIEAGVKGLEEKYGTFFTEVFMKIIGDMRNPDATPEQLVILFPDW